MYILYICLYCPYIRYNFKAFLLDDRNWPEANTCINQLNLPEYPTEEPPGGTVRPVGWLNHLDLLSW